MLYVKMGIHLAPYILGGGQEKGMRSSTENVAGIVSLATAASEAHSEMSILKEKAEAGFAVAEISEAENETAEDEVADNPFVEIENGFKTIYNRYKNTVRGDENVKFLGL